MNLYDTVKRLCEERNISIRQLEQSVKFLPRYIYKWETSSPSIDKVIKVADYFGISLDELCGRKMIENVQKTSKLLKNEQNENSIKLNQIEVNCEILNFFNELNEQGQEIALNMMRTLAATPIYKNGYPADVVEKA